MPELQTELRMLVLEKTLLYDHMCYSLISSRTVLFLPVTVDIYASRPSIIL